MREASCEKTDPEGILVGMSGGVDSAVAALLLMRQGYRVVAATLALWADSAACHAGGRGPSETVSGAKVVADQLGIPHLTVDAAEAFRSGIVEYFVEEYARGNTPNPCAKCNSRFRFRLMLEVARSLGMHHVATGHYARMMGEPRGLARGVDRAKDQSYVLAEVPPELLRDMVFPLGGLTKAEVRAMADSEGLVSKDKPESQELCFIPDDDHRRFLRSLLGRRPGNIVDMGGAILGEHAGTYNYTIGQRRGLGIAGEEPLYVVGLDAGRREVVVGGTADAMVGAVTLTDTVAQRPAGDGELTVQVRSSGRPVGARLSGDTVSFDKPVTGVAPGQTAVVYQGDVVVLGGTIASTVRWGALS